MLRWLVAIWRWLFPLKIPPIETAHREPYRDALRAVSIRCYTGKDDPPPLHWKACHPSTMKRFKAEITCSRGHGIVLKEHTIAPNGQVSPSVVCLRPNCDFHEFIRLEDWEFGPIQ